MNVPWEVFLIVISGLIGLGAVILTGLKYFGTKFLDGIEKQFGQVFERLDKVADKVGDASVLLAEHKLYDAETYATKKDLRDHRDDCPAKKAIME